MKEEGITKCYHCGESCNGSIVFNAHPFCCEGCKTVFEILNENNLCDFYSMNETPGASLKDAAFKKRFGYLDDELVKSKLIKLSL